MSFDVIVPTELSVDVFVENTPVVDVFMDGSIYIDASPVGIAGPPGPPGPQGSPGTSTSLWEYNYAAGATPPPSAGTFRSDGLTAAISTVIWVHRLDITDADRKVLLMLATIGDEFYIQDVNNSDAYAVFTLDNNPVDDGNYITFDVTFDHSAGTLTGNLRCLIGVIIVGVPGPQGPPGPSGPAGTVIHVAPTSPSSPEVDDLWVDTT